MPRKHIPVAIAYDFDGTLAPGNMQERDFIPAIGMTTSAFWSEVRKEAAAHGADQIHAYMKLMVDKANAAKVGVQKKNFHEYGRNLTFFDGVLPYTDAEKTKIQGWFDRINVYGKESGVCVRHFIISSGIREMIEGTPICKKFAAVFASSFWYDQHNVAQWPALALNYTTKTQYLFRINKGSLSVHDDTVINKFVPNSDRPVPFENIVYIGDGETDVPCFRLVKDLKGHAIAVFPPYKRRGQARPRELMKEGRVNFTAHANYCDGSTLDRIVKGIIDKIAGDNYLRSLVK